MNTNQSIQEVADNIVRDDQRTPIPTPTQRPTPILTEEQPNLSNETNLITTNDILNHDYNQMRIDEGRAQRMSMKKEGRDDNSDIMITHVTLNLDIVENRPHSIGSTWKYNSIKKNGSFANPAKINSLITAQKQNTSRSNLSSTESSTPNNNYSNQYNKKVPLLLYMSSSNRQSTTYGSDTSENTLITEAPNFINNRDTNGTYSQLSNRTMRTRQRSRTGEGSLIGQNNRPPSCKSRAPSQQRVNFERSTSRTTTNSTRPQSNFSNQSKKPVTYMDIIRSKSSADSPSSMHSADTRFSFGTNVTSNISNKRNSPRHTYTVAEFNKFKNKLLKNHSRNYYQYNSVNLNNEFLKNNGEENSDNHKNIIHAKEQNQPPLIQQGYHIATDADTDISHKPKPERQLSQIKSIYETIQRANNSKLFSLEMRRNNYLNSVRNTNNILTSSLMVQKMSQRI